MELRSNLKHRNVTTSHSGMKQIQVTNDGAFTSLSQLLSVSPTSAPGVYALCTMIFLSTIREVNQGGVLLFD